MTMRTLTEAKAETASPFSCIQCLCRMTSCPPRYFTLKDLHFISFSDLKKTRMSTQYDSIGTSYDEMRKLPIANLQDHNVQEAVIPYIKGAKVLDLACGTGYYSNAFLEWRALKAVGVDISSAMVDAAMASSVLDRLSFEVADCSIPKKYEGGPFDLVFGAWLLNYAPSGTEMASMFRNADVNLKGGGHFVGITPHPTQDPRGHVEKALAVKPLRYGGVSVTITGDVEGGVATHLETMTDPKVEFDAYHLQKSVYEIAARAGGLQGALTWRPVVRDTVAEADTSWDTYFTVPHFAVMVVAK